MTINRRGGSLLRVPREFMSIFPEHLRRVVLNWAEAVTEGTSEHPFLTEDVHGATSAATAHRIAIRNAASSTNFAASAEAGNPIIRSETTAVSRTLLAQETQANMRGTGLGISTVGSTLITQTTQDGMRIALGLLENQTVTGNHTIGSELIVNVNAATATITLPADLPIGTRKLVRKIHATQGAVTIARSGTEAFTRAALTSVDLNANGDFWLLEKVADTRWELVDGCNTGENSDGLWERYPDGTQICRLQELTASIAITTASGSLFRSANQTWTFPVAFVAGDSFSYAGSINGITVNNSGYLSRTAAPGTGSQTYYITSPVPGTGAVRLTHQARGRWYA
jgi:hypothetical protein